MPMYDRTCPEKHIMLDCWERINHMEPVLCQECGQPTERTWFQHPAAVIADDIVGGVWIRHGICNPDGTPKKYWTKSDIREAAKKKGMIQAVRHVGEPGSDKSKHTVKWGDAPQVLTPKDEELRKEHWWKDEQTLHRETGHIEMAPPVPSGTAGTTTAGVHIIKRESV